MNFETPVLSRMEFSRPFYENVTLFWLFSCCKCVFYTLSCMHKKCVKYTFLKSFYTQCVKYTLKKVRAFNSRVVTNIKLLTLLIGLDWFLKLHKIYDTIKKELSVQKHLRCGEKFNCTLRRNVIRKYDVALLSVPKIEWKN